MALTLLLQYQEAIRQNQTSSILGQLQRTVETPKMLKKQIKDIIVEPTDTIQKVLKLLCCLFYSSEEPSRLVIALYQAVSLEFSELTGNDMGNSLGLALINMKTYEQLNGGADQVKNILKKTKSYQGLNVDCILMAISLNNLAVLYLTERKFQKAFKYAYKAYSLVDPYISKLVKNNRPYLNEMPILINTHFILSQALIKMINDKSLIELKGEFEQHLEEFYWKGLEMSINFLGRNSLFTNMFLKIEPNAERNKTKKRKLPIVTSQPGQSNKNMIKGILNTLQQKINPRFEEIRRLIENYRPVASDNTVIEPKFDISKEKVLAQLKQNNNSTRTVITLKLLLSKNRKFGKVHVTIHVKDKLVTEDMLQDQTLDLIVSQVCVDDVRPLWVHYSTCSDLEFLKYYILPFIGLDVDTISIWPKPASIVPQKKIKFLGEQCYLFVFYVIGSTIRLSISPLDQSSSLHIDIQMTTQLAKLFLATSYYKPSTDVGFSAMFQHVRGQEFKYRAAPITLTIEQPKLYSYRMFETQLDIIMQRLQGFILENKLEETNKKNVNIFSSQDILIKVVMLEQKKLVLYAVKNSIRDKSVETTVQNLFQSYGPESLVKAKGYAVMEYTRVFKELSVMMNQLKPYEQKFILSLIASKYTLQIYDSPLETVDINKYYKNAIKQVNFISKIFKREFKVDEYTVPWTVSILTLNQEVPLGIRMTAYDTRRMVEIGLFIELEPELWIKAPATQKSVNEGPTAFIAPIKSANMKENFVVKYFLAPVMELGGFKTVLSSVKLTLDGGDALSFSIGDTKEVKWCRLHQLLSWNTFKQANKIA